MSTGLQAWPAAQTCPQISTLCALGVGHIHVHSGFYLQHGSCWGGQVTLGSGPQGDTVFLSLQTAWTSLV